ncbi:MAG: S41 family peptidase [Bacilli bacterium]|nr:S41 family peptidase [Bacilli bacterium]
MEKKEKKTTKNTASKVEKVVEEPILKIDNLKKDNSIKVLFLLIGIIIGILLTYLVMSSSKNPVGKIVRNTSKNTKFDSLYETYDAIKEKYYKDVDDETLINGAIDGMMKSLEDKHSMFFDLEEKKSFETELSGTYYGIGAEIKQVSDEEVMINKVFDDSPAEKAGLKSGDVFVSIDGESSKGKTSSEIAKNLRSEKKDSSVIVVRRDDEELTIEVQKDNVTLLSVSSEMLDNNIGYIAVGLFGEHTYTQFTKALNNLEEQDMKSLIIDLRGNGGGYLSIVTQMISEFVDQNTVIYQMKTREGIEKYGAINNRTKNYKVVILIDGESASASEIMASALQEQYNATLVGVTTYGKGTVQETLDLSNGTLIKYTIQEWLTSKGNSINDVGIKPDIEVELDDNYLENPSRENDNQLQKAIEILKN